MATISLLGLYQYDETILDGLKACLPSSETIPRDYPESYLYGISIDSQSLCNRLLFETAEQEILLTEPTILKFAIEAWARSRKSVWQELFNTLCYKYNPIWNKDGTVTWTEEEKGDGSSNRTKTGKRKGTDTTTIDGSDSSDLTHSATETPATTTTTTGQVSAYNATDFQNRDKQVAAITGNITTSGTDTTENSSSYTTTANSTIDDTDTENESRKDNKSTTHTQKDQGNIGVTMTQDMIAKQREIVQFNIYEFIIADFKKEFVLSLY